MGWGSVTKVARLPRASKDAVWQHVCSLSPAPARTPQKPVCCYSLQGICFFGASTCEFSHDASRVREAGCQFGAKCRLGHAAQAEAAAMGAGEDGLLTSRAAGRPDSFNLGGALLECRGPGHDDSDPLWEELASALVEAGEGLGDADLPEAARERLQEAGQYRLVDDDTADEWLCIPAAELGGRLEARREEVARCRRLWLGDDLREVRCLWACVLSALRSGVGLGGLHLGEGTLPRMLTSVDAALKRVWELQPKDKGAAGCGLVGALHAAQAAVCGLQRLIHGSAAQRLAGAAARDEEGLDESADLRCNLAELLSCLERCIFVAGAEQGRNGELKNGEVGVEEGAGGGLAVGATVQVIGLTAAAEQGLNGQQGQLERYDEALGLWQLCLAASGTRLLLGEDRVVSLRRPGAAEGGPLRGRSRSPRRQGDVKSVLEITQEAAKHGDHILVHHHVAWTGLDAKPSPSLGIL